MEAAGACGLPLPLGAERMDAGDFKSMGSKTPLLLFLGAALIIVLISCTGPTFTRPLHDPVMSNEEMHAELVRLDQVNLNVGSEDFDPSIYPVFVGFDFRKGKGVPPLRGRDHRR